MYWALVFLGVALAAAPFALAAAPAGGGAALVAGVFAALSVGALAAEGVSRRRKGAGTARPGPPLAPRSDLRHFRRT